jgi:bla regulator protein BlaR1
MILYILEVSIGWALFYLLYHFVLKQTTFFALNRWYLLLTFVVALILPVLPPLWSIHQPAEPTVSDMVNLELLLANLGYLQDFQVVEVEPEANSINWWLVAYWVGVLIMLLRFLYGMFQIARYFFTGKKRQKESTDWYLPIKNTCPFLFLDGFSGESTPRSKRRRQIACCGMNRPTFGKGIPLMWYWWK